MPLLISVMFCTNTVSSEIPLGVSVPSPNRDPKISEGSMAMIKTGSRIMATIGMIHFFEDFAASMAAP